MNYQFPLYPHYPILAVCICGFCEQDGLTSNCADGLMYDQDILMCYGFQGFLNHLQNKESYL